MVDSARPPTVGELLADVTSRLDTAARAMNLWTQRDDTRPEPRARAAANTAMVQIDGMLRTLHTLRATLLAEIRASDDAADARVDRLIARRREGGDA